MLEIEHGWLRERKGCQTFAGCGVAEVRVSDGVKRDFHLETVTRRVDEPSQAPFRLANVCDQIVFSCRGRNSSPRPDGQIRAWNYRNSCQGGEGGGGAEGSETNRQEDDVNIPATLYGAHTLTVVFVNKIL